MTRRKQRSTTKRRVFLNHEQKIEVAKEIVAGGHIKQVAAKWNISLDACYKVIQEYTVVARYVRIPENVA